MFNGSVGALLSKGTFRSNVSLIPQTFSACFFKPASVRGLAEAPKLAISAKTRMPTFFDLPPGLDTTVS
nr:MAG TPA: hypothetical protein [Caudoviricetes sp.]